jgi:hypothetical protein
VWHAHSITTSVPSENWQQKCQVSHYAFWGAAFVLRSLDRCGRPDGILEPPAWTSSCASSSSDWPRGDQFFNAYRDPHSTSTALNRVSKHLELVSRVRRPSESRSGFMEMPVACSSPIRARPQTSCAFPSERGISALNSARGDGRVYHVADVSRAATALRTDETAIPGDRG